MKAFLVSASLCACVIAGPARGGDTFDDLWFELNDRTGAMMDACEETGTPFVSILLDSYLHFRVGESPSGLATVYKKRQRACEKLVVAHAGWVTLYSSKAPPEGQQACIDRVESVLDACARIRKPLQQEREALDRCLF